MRNTIKIRFEYKTGACTGFQGGVKGSEDPQWGLGAKPR